LRSAQWQDGRASLRLRIDMALSSLSHAVVPGGAGTLRHLPEPTVLQIPTVARDPAERLDLFAILH